MLCAQSFSSVRLFKTHGLGLTRLLCPWNFPDKNTRVGCHFLFQGIFPNQGSNPSLLQKSSALASRFFTAAPSGSFPMSQLFISGGQSIGASASASVLPVTIQGWFPLRLTGLISLQSKRLASLLQHQSLKVSILWHSAFFMVQFSNDYWKNHSFSSVCWQTDISPFTYIA